jgi:2,3-bisphosphoglycerate-independent phosphoglycerate mutase
MKYLILVGDGMGDHPIAELDGKTPLDAARTPMMDELCRQGELFFTTTVPDGFPPGSDVANMSLMGYDPAKYYTGRAPLEAAAMGVHLAADEIAFRCNLVTIDHGDHGDVTMRDFAAGHISNEESHQIVSALEAECASDLFHFHPGVSYRHLLVFKGEHPGFLTVPPHDHIGRDVTEHWRQYLAVPEWQRLFLKAAKVLADHPINRMRKEKSKNPANMIWPWGEGKSPTMPTLHERFAITGSMISAVDLLKGLGVVGGLSVVAIPGATGYIDTNYEGKARAAIDSLAHQDMVFVHLEGPDEAGHQGLLADKIQAIEDFDARIVRPIIEHLRSEGAEFRAVITMDHYTPLAIRTHTREAVPTILYDSRKQQGSGCSFCERTCELHNATTRNSLKNGFSLIDRLLERD